MHEVLRNRRYRVAEVAQTCEVHVATVWRWILRGVRGRRLRSVLVGGRRYVLEGDLQAFLDGEGDDAQRHGDQQRQRRLQVAEAELDARGVRGRRHG